MRILLRSNWKDKILKTIKVYSLNNEIKKVINETFNKVHE